MKIDKILELSASTVPFISSRIVVGDKGIGVGVMGGLRGLNGMREEGTGNLLGEEG